MGGRSSCMSCGSTLSPLELVPIASFVFLRGCCRSCNARISAQYPLVEVLAGVLAVLCFVRFSGDSLSFSLAVFTWLSLLFIGIYDLRHKIIPDTAALVFGASALALRFALPGDPSIEELLAGPLLALPLLALSFVSRGRAMGWGDGKLAFGVGWLLGPIGGFGALLFSFWLGALVGLALLFLPLSSSRRRLTMKSEIPYAPFLIMGAAVAYFTSAIDFLSQLLF